MVEIQVGQPHLANPIARSLLIGALPLVHPRKPAIFSGFGCVEELGPNDLPSPSCLIWKGPKHPFIPMSPDPGNTHRLACNLR